MGVKEGFHPLDHGYDHFLGLPESNDYGCTDTTMGAPDSGLSELEPSSGTPGSAAHSIVDVLAIMFWVMLCVMQAA